VSPLVEFLLARLAEDEQAALDAAGYESRVYWDDAVDVHAIRPASREHYERHDPDRVLAQCRAHRALAEVHRPYATFIWDDSLGRHYEGCEACAEPHDWDPHKDGDWFPCITLRHLAAAYDTHPEYQREWAP